MDYWHNLIVEKSWNVLQQLKGKFDFILIGGWASYFWTKASKSKARLRWQRHRHSR